MPTCNECLQPDVGLINGVCVPCRQRREFPGPLYEQHGIIVSRDARDVRNTPCTRLRAGLPLKTTDGRYIDCPLEQADCILEREIDILAPVPPDEDDWQPADTPAMAIFLTDNAIKLAHWAAAKASRT